MGAILLFGFLLGVRHALEADHIASVATIATRASSVRATVGIATAWGAGHTAALVVFGLASFAAGASVPPSVERYLEMAVGATLIVLGTDILRRLRSRRVHVHVHHHGDGVRHVHLHAHDHAGDPTRHEHEHPRTLLPRALVVGGIHGLAGSAALTLLTLQALPSIGAAFVYLVLFGAGSMLGVIVFSLGLSVPLRLSARHLGWGFRGLETVLGCTSVALGCWIVVRSVL